jgi:hypothetical protein
MSVNDVIVQVTTPGTAGEGDSLVVAPHTKRHMLIEWKEVTMGELLEADGLSAVLKHCAENEINPIMEQSSNRTDQGNNDLASEHLPQHRHNLPRRCGRLAID